MALEQLQTGVISMA